ncbi:MAG: stage II sporulation protein R [Anaeroplasmataceae bacterium]|nr:stage II sporulation protein R [Anaeroplasmataceae bacterium]MDE6415392.1 stage II sporulation protein R [Anaeroplasmataceae bacterium]
MRKIIIIGIIILCAVMLFSRSQEEKEIRVRIIPNSDEASDLKVKEKAKNITVCYLKEAYDEEYNTYLKNLKQTISLFEVALEKELKEDVEVQLGNHTLYNKTYNNSAVKNTSEMTLYVVIGEGKGSNWWGTVYPEFLSVNSSEEVKYESLILSIFKKIKGE